MSLDSVPIISPDKTKMVTVTYDLLTENNVTLTHRVNLYNIKNNQLALQKEKRYNWGEWSIEKGYWIENGIYLELMDSENSNNSRYTHILLWQ